MAKELSKKDKELKIKKANDAAMQSSKDLEKKILFDQKMFKVSIKKLENKIIDMAADFDTEKGKLIGYKTNIAQAQKIHSDLKTLFDETYGKASIKSVKGYADVAKKIQSNLKEMGEEAQFTSVDKTMIEALQDQSLDQYAVYGQQAQQKIVSSMYDAVISGGRFSSLVNSISETLTGSLSKQGKPMEQYAELWANDGVMNFHQDVLNKKGEDAGLTSYLYVGNIMLTTRDFCKERVGNIYTKEQVESWNDQKWQGKSGPAMTHRGGYNCRHHWQPVDPEWVDETMEPEPKQIKLNPVAKNIVDPANVKKYIEYEDEYVTFFKDNLEEAQKHAAFFEGDVIPERKDLEPVLGYINVCKEKTKKFENAFEGVERWQRSTQTPEALALKFKGEIIENLEKSPVKYEYPEDLEEAKEELKKITDEQYLRMRAFNQAYMKTVLPDTKSHVVFRGTDGGTGVKMVEELIKEKNKDVKYVNITDAGMSGYTTDIKTAYTFGKDRGGFTITKTILNEDIIVHKNMMSGLTQKKLFEAEFIVKGGTFEVDFSNLEFTR